MLRIQFEIFLTGKYAYSARILTEKEEGFDSDSHQTWYSVLHLVLPFYNSIFGLLCTTQSEDSEKYKDLFKNYTWV